MGLFFRTFVKLGGRGCSLTSVWKLCLSFLFYNRIPNKFLYHQTVLITYDIFTMALHIWSGFPALTNYTFATFTSYFNGRLNYEKSISAYNIPYCFLKLLSLGAFLPIHTITSFKVLVIILMLSPIKSLFTRTILPSINLVGLWESTCLLLTCTISWFLYSAT